MNTKIKYNEDERVHSYFYASFQFCVSKENKYFQEIISALKSKKPVIFSGNAQIKNFIFEKFDFIIPFELTEIKNH